MLTLLAHVLISQAVDPLVLANSDCGNTGDERIQVIPDIAGVPPRLCTSHENCDYLYVYTDRAGDGSLNSNIWAGMLATPPLLPIGGGPIQLTTTNTAGNPSVAGQKINSATRGFLVAYNDLGPIRVIWTNGVQKSTAVNLVSAGWFGATT